MLEFYKRLSVVIFGRIAEKYIDAFKALKPYLAGANINMMLKTWSSVMLLSSVLAYIASVVIVWAVSLFVDFELVMFIYLVLFLPVLVGAVVFLIFYIYPIQRTNMIRNSIDGDLPFAVSHMSAIASSGIPTEFMFQLLVDFKEYKHISEHANLVVRNIKTFGMSSTNAIESVAERTPSVEFKQLLNGIVSTIEKGGNLIDYLNEMSKKYMFDYRIKRENYLKLLSTYADIYTALLVAAPLMMLSVLGIMNIIGGQILGLTINELVWLMTWVVLPLMNGIFLLFIHITYPKV